MIESVTRQTPIPTAPGTENAALRKAAVDLEAAFLAEMLGAAGLGASAGSFGGGEGEEQFASLLRREQANAVALSGGIGLAESIYRSLVARADGPVDAPDAPTVGVPDV